EVPQPSLDETRKPRELVDLRRPGPRVALQATAGQAGVENDDSEAAGEVAPATRVSARGSAAAVRRDDQRERRVASRSVPGGHRDHDAVTVSPRTTEANGDESRPGPLPTTRPARGRPGAGE